MTWKYYTVYDNIREKFLIKKIRIVMNVYSCGLRVSIIHCKTLRCSIIHRYGPRFGFIRSGSRTRRLVLGPPFLFSHTICIRTCIPVPVLRLYLNSSSIFELRSWGLNVSCESVTFWIVTHVHHYTKTFKTFFFFIKLVVVNTSDRKIWHWMGV